VIAVLLALALQAGDCAYVRDLTVAGQHWWIDDAEILHLNEQTGPVFHLLTQRAGVVYGMYQDGRWFELQPTQTLPLYVTQLPGCPPLPASPRGHRITVNRGFLVDVRGRVWAVVPATSPGPGAVLVEGSRYSGSDRADILEACGDVVVVHRDGVTYGIDAWSLLKVPAAGCQRPAVAPPTNVRVS
jgi:hypothetical protein